MPINETLVTGKKYRVWDVVTSKWKRISYWTKASDVEFDDGATAEAKISDINDSISQLNSSLDDLYNNGVKNFYPIVEAVGHDGISCVTNMDDGTITTSGTSTIANVIHLAQVSFPTSIQVKISGAPSSANGNRKLQLADITNNYSIVEVDQGSGATATLTANHVYEIRIYYATGINMDGLVWKPMMTLASCPNSDYAHYVPYAQSNAALTKRAVLTHNIPRFVPKDITSYVTDGTLWQRLNGTNGFELFEDIYCGDYIHMSRAISAYEQTQTYQATGSDYVTIAEIDGKMGDGDSSPVNYHHLVMVPGKGFGGTQHFGRSRMNATNTTVGGYKGSEMFTTTIGAVVSSGSTASQATINQQLYSEFGSHLKTIRQILSNSINATGYNRFGTNSGCANNWEWTSVQAFLMSEIEVYGSVVWGSSGYDVGNGNHQFTLFRHSKEAMNNKTAYYWLKDVASAADFARVVSLGFASCGGARDAGYYVRPCFVIA